MRPACSGYLTTCLRQPTQTMTLAHFHPSSILTNCFKIHINMDSTRTLVSPSNRFPRVFKAKILHAFIVSEKVRTIYRAQLYLRDFTALRRRVIWINHEAPRHVTSSISHSIHLMIKYFPRYLLSFQTLEIYIISIQDTTLHDQFLSSTFWSLVMRKVHCMVWITPEVQVNCKCD